MARTVRNAKIDTRSARAKLTKRREPYWTTISPGCALGYRRGKSGTWIARLYGSDKNFHYQSLGAADDTLDADGHLALSFGQAQEHARAFFAKKARELAGGELAGGPYTIAVAFAGYFAERENRGSKGLAKDRSVAKAHILPALGSVELSKLTSKRIRDWHAGLAAACAKGKGVAVDFDAMRARRASANRIMKLFRAGLNHAFHTGKVASDEAWRKVKLFREADAPVIRYLAPQECLRLVNACTGTFRDLVCGALLSGCRYGELIRLKAGDFDSRAGTVTVRVSKSGKPRHVVLTDEGRTLFSKLTSGHAGQDLIFTRDGTAPWKGGDQQRRITKASLQAGIHPVVTFHVLRHSHASALAQRGAPMAVIAAQIGHASTAVTERHYAHLSPSYVAEAVRAALPVLGIAGGTDG